MERRLPAGGGQALTWPVELVLEVGAGEMGMGAGWAKERGGASWAKEGWGEEEARCRQTLPWAF